MKIAVDAMGGDHAPAAIVEGAVLASPDVQGTIVLVGDPARIQQHLPKPCPSNIEIHPASQVIEMHEKPIDAIRKKKDASLVVAAELVRRGQAEAIVSAGNTGAAAAGCLLAWRQIPGFHRPAIATTMPSRKDPFVLLDAGASPDVDPEHLVEFAVMGRAYSQRVMGRPTPTVHLLNIGSEEGKGNAFVGNVVLKTSEGVAEFIMKLIREQVPASGLGRLPYLPMKKALEPLKHKLDYAEYGGSPLLGLNGLCIICHGRSNPKAIRNALLQAQKGVENKLVECMRTSISNKTGERDTHA